jgi:hypothetical protein
MTLLKKQQSTDNMLMQVLSALALSSLGGSNGASTAAAAAGEGGNVGRRCYFCRSSIASRELFDGDDQNYSNDRGKMEVGSMHVSNE